MEWMLIFVNLVSGPSPEASFTRFANEAECKSAAMMVVDLTKAMAGEQRYLARWQCVPVTRLGENG